MENLRCLRGVTVSHSVTVCHICLILPIAMKKLGGGTFYARVLNGIKKFLRPKEKIV
jgi:hypothetical protein